MNNGHSRFLLPVGVLLLALQLAACGGGGSGGGDEAGPPEPDTTPPSATISTPAPDTTTEAESIAVQGTASDASEITAVRVNGIDATSDDGFSTWNATVPVSVGMNSLTVETGDIHGNTDSSAAQVSVERLPALSLTPQSVKTFHFSWDDAEDETEYRLLENPDGVSGYTEVATMVADTTSYDHEVFLPARINASYIVQACNDDGCSDSESVHVEDSLADAVGYVKASNTGSYYHFGYSVALSADGSTLAVGAYGEDSSATGIDGDQADNSASYSGAVYVFTRDESGWSQQAYVKASNAENSDYFGHSVALSGDGNTLAVGAYREESNATGIDGDQTDNSASDSGAVYVFTRDAGVWSQQSYVKASSAESGDWFGDSVALASDGNTLAVGARREDSNATGIGGDQTDNSAGYSGAVYVFTRDESVWSQQAYVKASNTGDSDYFGHSVALAEDGNTLVVGAYGEDSNATGIDGDQTNRSALYSGAVYVFTRAADVWSQQAYVKASNTETNDLFGYSVALSADGNTLAVGAHREASNATGIGGDETNNSAEDSGVVYVFTRDESGWTQQAYVKASNTSDGDHFGFSVALSNDGNTLAVGARREASNATGIGGDQTDNSAADSGAVYVFNRDAGVWSQQAYVKASNTESDDYFGRSVALSDDGSTLAVGAPREDSNATGIGGDQGGSTSNSGAVYLY